MTHDDMSEILMNLSQPCSVATFQSTVVAPPCAASRTEVLTVSGALGVVAKVFLPAHHTGVAVPR